MLAHRTALAALVLCLAPACRTQASLPPGEVPPWGTWTFEELEGADLSALTRAPELTLASDGSMNGFAGVNRFSGELDAGALRRGRIATTPLVMTRMAGPPAAMDAETLVLRLLAEPLEWQRAEGTLVLERDGASLARLRAK